MAQRLRYTGAPVLTYQDVDAQVQGLPADQQSLVTDVIIPAVTAQAEAITGAAIREAEYAEHWPAGGRAGGWLDVGQVKRIISVQAQGAAQPLPETAYSLHISQRMARLQLHDMPPQPLLITYAAGLNLEAYPSVKQWLVMQAATLFAQREVLVTGTIVAKLPESFIDSMLADIVLPPRF